MCMAACVGLLLHAAQAGEGGINVPFKTFQTLMGYLGSRRIAGGAG